MAIKPILTAENPILRQKSKKVTMFNESLQRLVDDLFDTLRSVPGVGLAAPQIGVLQRVYVVEIPAEYDEDGNEVEPVESYALINPEFVKMRGEELMEEGCLSIPGYRGRVKRATNVIIKAQDLKGKPVRWRAYDFLAQVFQHEYDHLDGILYVDRIEGPENLWAIPVGEEEIEEAEMVSAD